MKQLHEPHGIQTSNAYQSGENSRFRKIADTHDKRKQGNKNPVHHKPQVGIIPSYSTLPANVGHFAFGQTATSPANNAVNFIAFTFEVPNGRVIFANAFRCNVVDTFDGGGVSLGVPPDVISIGLFVNNVSEPYNQLIKIQPFDDFYPCTIVAAPKAIITIGVTYDYTAVPAAIASVLFKTDLTGDMLFQNEMQTENTALRLPVLPVGVRQP